MAPRPVWKGQIRLSLVSIPVEIFTATQSSASISFRQIHRDSGKRIHYEKVAAGIGPVDKDDIVKGYEVGKDDYVILTDEEIEDVRLETKKTLELVQFVDTTAIPPLYFDKPYYVVPQDELAEDAFRVVRDALRQAGKTGLGQLSMRGKEYLVALRPCGKGLLLETLHYEEEVRKSDLVFSEISDELADADLLDVASQLIERKSGPFDAGAFKNHYTDALKKLIAEKRKKGGKVRVEVEEEESAPSGKGSNVVDLMASLKKSLEADAGGGSGGSTAKSSGGKASASKSTASRASKAGSSGSRSQRSESSSSSSKSAPAKKSGGQRKSA